MKTPAHLNRPRVSERLRTSMHRERPACPECLSMYVRRTDHGKRAALKQWACKKCGREFSAPSVPVEPKPVVMSGSGNLAVPRRPEPVQPMKYDAMAHMRLCSERR